MVSVIINEHHIGDLTSLYYKKNIRAFLRREQDEIENFTGLFSKKGNSSPEKATMRQNVSKRLKERQMASTTMNEISIKSPLLISQDTQHKLGVAFSYLET